MNARWRFPFCKNLCVCIILCSEMIVFMIEYIIRECKFGFIIKTEWSIRLTNLKEWKDREWHQNHDLNYE